MDEGYSQGKGRALSQLALHADAPIVAVDNLLSQRQTHPKSTRHALTAGIRTPEPGEDASYVLLGYLCRAPLSYFSDNELATRLHITH